MISTENLSSLVLFLLVFFSSSLACHFYEKSYDHYVVIGDKTTFPFRISLYKHSIVRLILSMIIILPPVILSTFRSNEIGTDTLNYLREYQFNKNIDLFDYLSIYGTYMHEIEVGYQQIMRLSFALGGGFNCVKGLTSFLCIFFVWRGALFYHRKYSIKSGFCVLLYFFLEFTYSWNGARYAIGLSIFFFAFQFVIDKKPINYLICCCLMMCFHSSLVIAIGFYAINLINYRDMKRSIKPLLIIVFVCLIILLRPIVSYVIPIISKVFPKLNRYEVDTGAVYGIGLVFVFLLFFLPLLKWDSFVYANIEWMPLMMATLLFIPLRFLGYYSPWLIRLSRLPEILFCVLFCGVIKVTERSREKYMWIMYVFILSTIFYILTAVLMGKDDVYPYIMDFNNCL